MYKIGCTDKIMVIRLQQFLKLPLTGIFDNTMKAAVMLFQGSHNLIANGIVGRDTLNEMGILDTDLRNSLHFVTPEGLFIQKHYLPEGEFIRETAPVLNTTLILHHTAGWNDPYGVVDDWAHDQRGAIGTEFVIGGQRITNGNDDFDGVVVQAFPEGCRAWHVGSDVAYYMNRHSVGIESCNFGWLTDAGKTYVNTLAIESQIVTLTESFKGHTKFHKYSDKQLYALKRLINYIATRDNIDVRKGLIEWIHKDGPIKAFDFHPEILNDKTKGMYVHGNVIKTKDDMHPQPELVDMLLNL